jgi:Domain of unknown function (DUF2382)
VSARGPEAPGLRLEPLVIVKGGARVSVVGPAHAAAPADPLPALSPDDVVRAGLFQPRLIEFEETREETIVAARPFVREELVVGRTAARRVERIEETVRRTEIEVESLPSGAAPDDRATERRA